MTRTVLVSFAVVLSLSAAALAQSVQTTQPEIPGVVAAGTTVQLIKDGFQGTEGPVGTPDGGLYFTDPAPFAFAGQPEPTEKPPGFVYYLTPKGNLTLIDDQITRPNGISLSFDGKILFVADTDTENLWAFDVQPDGTTKNRRSFV